MTFDYCAPHGGLMQTKETEADEFSENKAKDETGDSTQNQETGGLMQTKETEEEKAKDENDNMENKEKGKSGNSSQSNGEEKLPGLDLRIPGHGVQIPGYGPIHGIRIPRQRTCSKGPTREEREKRVKEMLCSDTDDEPHTMEKELESYLTNTPNNNISKGKKDTSPTSNVAVTNKDVIGKIDEDDSPSKKREIK